jgi:hypothetical protein
VEAWITLAIGACMVVILTGLSAAMPSPTAQSDKLEPAAKSVTKPQLPPEVVAALKRNSRMASGD